MVKPAQQNQFKSNKKREVLLAFGKAKSRKQGKSWVCVYPYRL